MPSTSEDYVTIKRGEELVAVMNGEFAINELQAILARLIEANNGSHRQDQRVRDSEIFKYLLMKEVSFKEIGFLHGLSAARIGQIVQAQQRRLYKHFDAGTYPSSGSNIGQLRDAAHLWIPAANRQIDLLKTEQHFLYRK